jgi:Domain of unknown function (DUF6894)
MPRYFLHLNIGDEYFPDDAGQKLADLSLAHYRALLLATKLMSRVELDRSVALKHWIVSVENDECQRLLSVLIHPRMFLAKPRSTMSFGGQLRRSSIITSRGNAGFGS